MIQGVIGRMSGFSASAKNFCITICAAIIAVGFQNRSPLLNWAALGVVVLFFLMDSYYLSLERRYRDFYEQVTKRTPEPEPNMSLKAGPLTFSDFGKAMTSVSVLPFYALLMASMVGLLYVATHVQHPSSEATAVGPRSLTGTAEGADGKRAIPAGASIGRPEDGKQRVEPVRPTSATGVRTR
jgi:hypothetical protein